MLKKIKPENLQTYLRKIDLLFPEFKSDSPISQEDISTYYRESYWGYALFQSWAGAIHMALSQGEKVKKNDYFRQAEEVAEAISEVGDGTILEVGCGRGFNLRYLAQVHENLEFIGVDLSQTNVRSATSNTSHLPNIKIYEDDFQELSTIGDSTVSAIFAVETLCHSPDMNQTLRSLGRVLRPGGILIIYDGFRNNFLSQSPTLQKAVVYTEKAMAVPEFRTVARFTLAANQQGFSDEIAENRSAEIMPNLVRLSDYAKAFFKIEFFSRLIKAILPSGLVTNSIAGLLMAVTVQEGAHKYMKLVFRKK